tara:strand:- start:3524 stop:4099 length:576 start_codon:yes stop_codon:yes gene_type:complete
MIKLSVIFLYVIFLFAINKVKVHILDDRINVLSTFDNMYYKVRKGQYQGEVANKLAKCKSNMNKILRRVIQTRQGPEIDRLKQKGFNIPLEELSKRYEGEAAYSVDKGSRIGICIKDKNDDFEDENTMLFVLCHEYAHVMTNEWGHTAKFWNNMKILLKAAEETGLYEYQNYNKDSETYCGHDINSTPYEK